MKRHRRKRKPATPAVTLTSPRQMEIARFVRQCCAAGISPTLDEIADKLGISKVTVLGHLRNMQDRGAVSWSPHKARSLVLSAFLVLPDDRKIVCPHCRCAFSSPAPAVNHASSHGGVF